MGEASERAHRRRISGAARADAARACYDGALGRGDRAAHGRHLRRARHRRQGRHDPRDRARAEPAPVQGRVLAPPTEREQGQWYFQRYAEHHLPAKRRNRPVRPQLVQPRGRRVGDGLLHPSRGQGLSRRGSALRAPARRGRHLPVQILAVLRPGQAGGKAFERRLHNPLKRWKLSDMDVARASATPITRERARTCSPRPTPVTRPGR